MRKMRELIQPKSERDPRVGVVLIDLDKIECKNTESKQLLLLREIHVKSLFPLLELILDRLDSRWMKRLKKWDGKEGSRGKKEKVQ